VLFVASHRDVHCRTFFNAKIGAGAWCCSEQFDADVAKAALAIGLAPEEAATGAVRKTG
jgi:hypothetical protein